MVPVDVPVVLAEVVGDDEMLVDAVLVADEVAEVVAVEVSDVVADEVKDEVGVVVAVSEGVEVTEVVGLVRTQLANSPSPDPYAAMI